MGLKNLAILAVVCILISIPAAMGGNGFKQLRLEADRGTYIGSDADAWLRDSIVISGNPTEFTVALVYHYSGNGQPTTTDGSHLILTTNLNPVTSGIQVTLSNMRYSDFGLTGIPNKTIAANEWTQFGPDEHGLTIFDYLTADHGILKSPNWYTVVRLDDINDGQYLKGDETNELLVDIAASASDANTRLHIDSIGTKPSSGEEVGFVGNPYSEDITWQYIPEFPTIALPVVAVLAIMFLMQRRKKEG